MAATRRRGQRVDDTEFELPLATALVDLLPNGQVTAGATWHFKVEGDTLVITRSLPSVLAP